MPPLRKNTHCWWCMNGISTQGRWHWIIVVSYLHLTDVTQDMIHTSTHKHANTVCRADTNIKHCTGMLCPTPSSFTVQLMQLVQLEDSPGCGCEGRRDRGRRWRGLRVSSMGGEVVVVGDTGRAFPQENISPSTTIESVRKPQAATLLSWVTEYLQTRSHTHHSQTRMHTLHSLAARTASTLQDDIILRHCKAISSGKSHSVHSQTMLFGVCICLSVYFTQSTDWLKLVPIHLLCLINMFEAVSVITLSNHLLCYSVIEFVIKEIPQTLLFWSCHRELSLI